VIQVAFSTATVGGGAATREKTMSDIFSMPHGRAISPR
jgi:hypothetical protein